MLKVISWRETVYLKNTLRWVLKRVGVNTKKQNANQLERGQPERKQAHGVLIGERAV